MLNSSASQSGLACSLQHGDHLEGALSRERDGSSPVGRGIEVEGWKDDSRRDVREETEEIRGIVVDWSEPMLGSAFSTCHFSAEFSCRLHGS